MKEAGPRLQLQLVKIEEGLGEGAVLHHEYISKTPEEQQSLKAMLEKKRYSSWSDYSVFVVVCFILMQWWIFVLFCYTTKKAERDLTFNR